MCIRDSDYTEEYQAYYHHEMLKTFATRPYLWSTHVWNMFDFAADARDEGGCQGRNNKGLVTYDRQTKKDSFFIYKAYWTCEPMVHVCGARFADRAPGQRDVTVYTNCPSAVSYTHLDVYKRQRESSSSTGQGAGCSGDISTERSTCRGCGRPRLTARPSSICLLYTSRCV